MWVLLLYSMLLSTGVLLRAIFFCRSLHEAFSATFNGTMVRAYRADSCFVELVYNVWWMGHINRFTLTSLPPSPAGQKKKRNVEYGKTKPPLTLRQNDCLFRRCHLSNTACFAAHKLGEGRWESQRGKREVWLEVLGANGGSCSLLWTEAATSAHFCWKRHDQRHCLCWKYSNTMATVYLDKYRGTAMLAIAVGPSALFQSWTMDGSGETGQSLF